MWLIITHHPGHQVIDELHQKGETADHVKPIAWIYKTGGSFVGAPLTPAYNAGVEGAMVWSPSLVAHIFDVAAQVSAQ